MSPPTDFQQTFKRENKSYSLNSFRPVTTDPWPILKECIFSGFNVSAHTWIWDLKAFFYVSLISYGPYPIKKRKIYWALFDINIFDIKT